MTFLEKIKPHLTSDDMLIQQTVLHAINEYPYIPEEWTSELLKEAFYNKEKLTSILIYVENQTINQDAINILIENVPTMDKSKHHLALNLFKRIEPELALQNKEVLEEYIPKDFWSLYDLISNGTEEEVYTKYAEIIQGLEASTSFQHDLYIKSKKLADCIVKKNWITEEEIELILAEEFKEQWFSYEGILAIYMIGLLRIEKHIPLLASLLIRDEDVLLEETSNTLIRFQSDEVVKEVAPYLNNEESIIFASSVVENIKSDLSIQVLRDAYHHVEELENQELLIEALCHQFSEKALPEIQEQMKNEYTSSYVDIEQIAYSYYSILGLDHPELEEWGHAALERELEFRNENKQSLLQSVPVVNENKVGRNEPCPCGSGKKYKKCCG